MPKYVVRYGVMRHLGVFSSRGRDRYARGHRVIARTGRGQEAGEVLCEATEHVLSQMDDPRTGQILRKITADDDVEITHIAGQTATDRSACEQRIKELELDMKIVDVERVYGGERVVVFYLAEDRVDFRELVKLLVKDLQTRVEMRHIGVRDEAKLLADYGDCGKPVCCNTHLSEMPPVSMKMAKLQKATLDPTKISGRCGRLKCCLRYEYDTYQDLKRELPPIGREVLTRDGRGRVLSQEILTGELLIETEEGRRVVIQSSDVLTVVAKEKSTPKKPPRESGEEPAEGKPKRKKPGKRRETTPDGTAPPEDGSEAASSGSEKPKKRRRRPRRGRGGPQGDGEAPGDTENSNGNNGGGPTESSSQGPPPETN